jgi:hypothetical protein
MCYIPKELNMSEVVKVCVRIPKSRTAELLELASTWRAEDQKLKSRSPGWDAKEIHRVADEKFGSLLQMYEKHGWTERGSDMMRQVQRRVKETYGSVENFVVQNT